MTEKERLEEVVKNVVFLQCGLTGAPMGVELPEDDYWYLYEQAERVQELEEEVDRLNRALHYQLSQENIRNEENRKLKYKNKRYREALEAIAYFDDKEEGEVATRIDVKYIARKALERGDYNE